jgi:hypothetical protein
MSVQVNHLNIYNVIKCFLIDSNSLVISTALDFIVFQCPPREGGQGGEMSIAPGNASSARN